MPRNIPVGNGTLLITFDHDDCLRDIYYPSIEKEYHTDEVIKCPKKNSNCLKPFLRL
jgi:hypothetical protein